MTKHVGELVQFTECSLEAQGAAILAILNHAITTSTALYDYHPRTMDNMVTWFAAKAAGNFPVIGAVNKSGTLMGFASYGAFRAFPAYKYTVEHSVYVHAEFRGQGLAKQLMHALIARAQAQGKHVLVGAIDADNAVSLKLHAELGFERVGTMPQVGFKFGRWLDLALVQRVLASPAQPEDD